MKFNKYIISLLAALPMLFVSCNNTQDEYFEDNSVVRQEKFIDEFRKTLLDSEYGWVMDYYPQDNQSIGGYVFCVKFTEDQVTAYSEMAPGQSVTSYYSFKKDIGPSLSFDTYNKILHYYFAEGTYNGYQSERGDFEFRLDSIVDGKVYMHGNKNKNTITLHKLTYDPHEYIAKAIDMRDIFYVDNLNGNINGTDINGVFTWNTRQLDLKYGDKSRDMAYTFTDKGIRLYQDISVGGVNISDLTYDQTNKSFIIDDGKGGTITIAANNPEWLDQYYAWQGEWILTCHEDRASESSPIKELNITLVPTKSLESYLIRGLNPYYDVEIEWRKADNSFYWTFQRLVYTGVGEENICMLPLSRPTDTGGFYIGTNTTYGMIGEWDEEKQALVWREKGNWTRVCQGFMLYLYNGGTRVSSLSSENHPEYLIDGLPGIYWLSTFKRK